MSYYTRMQLDWDDSDYTSGSLASDDIVRATRPFVEAMNWGVDDVLADLKESASGGGMDRPGYNRIMASELIAMVETISLAFPQVIFHARGIGEDFFDAWARQMRNGEVLWEFGPFCPEM